MALLSEGRATRPRLIWLGPPAILILAALAFKFPPDGTPHAPLAQFLGRFHPVLVHLPIALILLVPALEIAPGVKRWSQRRAGAGFVLALAAVTSVVTAFDGWLLAWSGGYRGNLVTRHMWSGVGLAALCVTLAGLRPRLSSSTSPVGRRTYALLMAFGVGLVVWTGDLGGEITHGATYMTEYMPANLRAWLHIAKPRPKPAPVVLTSAKATFYAVKIAPIFEGHCVSCHGPQKVKGGLRLDSYAHIMHGGEDGPVIAPWYPLKSDMMRRVVLPPDDDDAMPSGGKKPLSDAEIELIGQWIAAGASDKAPADAGRTLFHPER